MKQKLFAYGLSLTLLLVQNSFVYSQTMNNAARSSDELVALLDEPEAVVIVNVKKMLAEIAPTLLNNDAASIEKLTKMMRSIEGETGVNPYLIDKIVFGVKLGKTAEEPLVVLQSGDSAAKLAENIYQNQVANAKFADEINPLKNRIFFTEQEMRAIKDNVISQNQPNDIEPGMQAMKNTIIPQNQPSDADVKFFEEFRGNLAKLKPTKPEQVAFNKLKSDSDRLLELLKTYQSLLPTVYNLGDLPDRLTAAKTETESISASDAQRTAKIAAAAKNLTQIEQEFLLKRNRMLATDEARTLHNFSSAEFSGVPDDFATAAVIQRRNALNAAQKSVGERIEGLDFIIKEMKSAAPKPDNRMDEADKTDRENAPNPVSTGVTRKEETVGGKKLLVITTVKKYPADSLLESAPSENTMLVFDDKTLMMGDRATITKSLENKSANRSQIARHLIGKSPDALVSFGVDLRSVDLTDFAKAFGEQKTALQAFGALTSAGNDLSLSATVEKTDVPLNLAPKSNAAETSKPLATNNDAVDDLIGLLTKSIVGIEGKFTVRFEKKKAMAMFAQSPKLLSELLNNSRHSKNTK